MKRRHSGARRTFASLLAGAVAVATASIGLAVVAPSANAAGFSGTGVSACHLYFGSGLPGTPAGDDSLTTSNSTFAITELSLSDYSPAAGDTVTVTLKSSGLVTGPVAVTAGGLVLTAKVKLSGAQTNTVTLLTTNAGGSGTYPASTIPVNSAMGAFTMTGSFLAAGSGALTAAYQQLEAKDQSGSNADNLCDGTAAGTTVISSTTLTSNGQSAQTTNFSIGSTGFRVTRIIAGAFGWDVPPTWDPKNAAVSSASIRAAATVGGGVEPPPEVPAAPTGLAAVAGNQKVTLTWNEVSGATGYDVFRGPTKVGSPTDPTFVDTGLTNGTEYSYTVKATNATGSSPASAAATATPALAVPAAPTGLSAAAGDAKVALSWSSTSGATSYEVYRGAEKVGTPTDESYVDTGLTNGTEYSYTVKAVNASGAGPASAAVTATPKAAPKSSVEVTWQCQTLTQVLPWQTTMSAALTGTTLNLSFAPGPKSGPIAIADQGLKPTATVVVNSADVLLEGAPYGPIGVYAIVPGATLSGTVSGSLTSVPVKQVKFLDIASGSNVDTTCTSTTTVTVPVVTSAPLPPTVPESNGDLTITGTPTAGGEITLAGEGFAPGGAVTAGMYSDPVTLGVATADDSGKVSIKVVVPSGASGTHTFVLLGEDQSGGQWALTKEVTVTAVTPSPTPTDDPTDDPDPDNDGGLPKTGPEDFAMTLLWGAVALQIGLIVAVRASRSRGAAAPAGKHRR